MKTGFGIAVGAAAAGLATIAAFGFATPNAQNRTGNAKSNTGAAAKRTPVVVELFTSEGCSSCPSADKLLAQIAKAQDVPGVRVIVLSEHVDYWNRMGWRDPYSARQFTDRQNAHAARHAKPEVYTPQAVVDGGAQLVGSNESELRAQVLLAAQLPKTRVDLTVKPTVAGVELTAIVGKSPQTGPIRVQFAITEDNLVQNVTDGENAGARLSHHGVVRILKPGAKSSAGGDARYTATLAIPQGWKTANLRAVAFAEHTATGKILGADDAELPRSSPTQERQSSK